MASKLKHNKHNKNNHYRQEPLLYIVAMPIGNPKDITLRALEVLQGVDMIYCEDTRVTNKILSFHGIKASMHIYNDFSNQKIRDTILNKLNVGKKIALVSDAGTPLISDPGYKLVQDLIENKIPFTSLPGASSVTTALTLSGLPVHPFTFIGFLPVKQQERKNFLSEFADSKSTLVVFESARRLKSTLSSLFDVLGDRDMSLQRELTKTYEEVRNGTVSFFIDDFSKNPLPKGEIVMVVAPSDKAAFSNEDIDAMLRKSLAKLSVKEAVSVVSDALKISRKQVYQRALEIKNAGK